MLRKIAFAAALAGASFAVPAFAADSPVVGVWDIAAETQMGKFESTMTVAEAGGAYTVDIKDKPATGRSRRPIRKRPGTSTTSIPTSSPRKIVSSARPVVSIPSR